MLRVDIGLRDKTIELSYEGQDIRYKVFNNS